MLENNGNTISRLAMNLLGRNLTGRIASCSRHVRQNGVAMATAVAALWTFSSYCYRRLEAERVNQL